uniref:MADS-box domain-containing protein n=1 Tax=Oryza glumipatula TaxID=40148 RepID=A0A0E0BQ25_9ORYZ
MTSPCSKSPWLPQLLPPATLPRQAQHAPWQVRKPLVAPGKHRRPTPAACLETVVLFDGPWCAGTFAAAGNGVNGLLKKAYELSVLYDAEVTPIIFSNRAMASAMTNSESSNIITMVLREAATMVPKVSA